MPEAITARFFLFLVQYEAMLLVGLAVSFVIDEAAVQSQITRRMIDHKFLTFVGNPDHISAFVLLAPLVAFVLARYQLTWRSEYGSMLWIVSLIVAVVFQLGMTSDSRVSGHWSALAIDGRSTDAALVHILALAWGVKTALSFFLQTPLDQIEWWVAALVAAGFAIHMGIGILGPTWVVNKHIHSIAWAMVSGVWTLIGVGLLRLLSVIKVEWIA